MMVGHVPFTGPASAPPELGTLQDPCEQRTTVPSHVAPGAAYVTVAHFEVESHAAPIAQSLDAAHAPPTATGAVQAWVLVPVQTSGVAQF